MVSPTIVDPKMEDCPALVTVRLLSGKWKTRILWHLRRGAAGFGDLQRALPGVSAKMLSQHLADLCIANVVERRSEKRGRVIHSWYDYSPYGRTLIPVLDAVGEWGRTHQREQQTTAPVPAAM